MIKYQKQFSNSPATSIPLNLSKTKKCCLSLFLLFWEMNVSAKNANTFLNLRRTKHFLWYSSTTFWKLKVRAKLMVYKIKVWTNCLSKKVCVFCLKPKVLKVRHTIPASLKASYNIYVVINFPHYLSSCSLKAFKE